jgi:preprotein translocase subunit Sec61beta
MADEKIRMPSGIGGLVRYFDDYKSKLEINKTYFVAFVLLVIIFYLFLYFRQ